MHCLIGFDREICRLVDVLVILVEEQQTAELQICTVSTLISWLYWLYWLRQGNCRFVLSAWYLGQLHLPLLERVQLASREGHQGNFKIGQIIHIKTTCSNFFLKFFKHWNNYDLDTEQNWKIWWIWVFEESGNKSKKFLMILFVHKCMHWNVAASGYVA